MGFSTLENPDTQRDESPRLDHQPADGALRLGPRLRGSGRNGSPEGPKASDMKNVPLKDRGKGNHLPKDVCFKLAFDVESVIFQLRNSEWKAGI